MQRSALCRSRRELSSTHFVAKFGFDTAESEPSKVNDRPGLYPTRGATPRPPPRYIARLFDRRRKYDRVPAPEAGSCFPEPRNPAQLEAAGGRGDRGQCVKLSTKKRYYPQYQIINLKLSFKIPLTSFPFSFHFRCITSVRLKTIIAI